MCSRKIVHRHELRIFIEILVELQLFTAENIIGFESFTFKNIEKSIKRHECLNISTSKDHQASGCSHTQKNSHSPSTTFTFCHNFQNENNRILLFYQTDNVNKHTEADKKTTFAFLFTALLSAQEIPLSDKLSQEIEITPELVSASNETISKDETTTFLAPGNSSENASIEESGADTMPPRLFPSDEEKILPGNDTILKILQNSSSQGVKSSEVIDFSRTKDQVETILFPIWLANVIINECKTSHAVD